MQKWTSEKPISTRVDGPTESQWTPERASSLSRSAFIVIVSGIALGLFAAVANQYYVCAVIAGAVLAILIAWQFEAALVVYVLAAFIPWGRTPDLAVGGSGAGKGLFVSEAMLACLLVIWLGKYLFGSLPKDRFKTGFYVPIALYLVYCVVNVVHSFLFWDQHVNIMYQHLPVNFIELGIRFLSAGALVMLATTITSSKWLHRMTVALILVATYNAVTALFGVLIPFQAPWWSLITLLPSSYGCAVMLDANYSWVKRIFCGLTLAILLFIVVFKGMSWVSGWLGLLAGLGAVLLIKSRKLFVMAVLLVCIAVFVLWPFFHKNVVQESKNGGDYDRFALMAGALRYATTFPLGVGLGNYRTYNSFYYGEKWGTTNYSSAHGTYSQALAETGIPGMLLFLAVLIGGLRWFFVRYANLRDGPSKTFLLAAIGQLVGIAVASFVGDYIIPSYHNGGLVTFSTTVYSWMIWGLAIAHVRISGEDSNGSIDINS